MPSALEIDRMILALIVFVLVLTVGIYLVSPTYFALSYAAEDRLVEYGTAVSLFVACLILLRNGMRLRGRATKLAVGLTFFYAFMFFFGAGEEISWGQRIFGWETSEAMKQINRQDETTIHNIEIGGVALTKHLFGPVLTVTILLYLMVLPLLYPRVAGIRAWADRIALPVPGRRHAVLALLSTIVIALISVDRKWEVYELIFGLLVVSIFLLPQNREHVQ
ncbi:hypothetical protein EI983_15080 [Roseovarius faecimaris]|uniref:Uncharacterized protein n=1 Tax=Roseovarius faecimaris TaxID=2494550 RepID=A0A6I6IR17_9RHOB|nr:hypothetical protein [Roseovarius faecimaris]QGX99519.1 hypothetical protein EI983_15080 [Roseovarius faecimaris]